MKGVGQIDARNSLVIETHNLSKTYKEALTVIEFSRKKVDLEEIFMSIVEGGQDGR